MSNDWTSWLQQALSQPIANNPLRVVVMGIGNELRGDDAAGVMVARALQPVFAQQSEVLIVDSGHAPENHTGTLRRFAPNLVLLVDTACMGEAAGTVHWLEWHEIGGLISSTHTLSLDIVAQYLHGELDCEVGVIGIQPEQTDIGNGLSPSVQCAINEIIHILTAHISQAEESDFRSR